MSHVNKDPTTYQDGPVSQVSLDSQGMAGFSAKGVEGSGLKPRSESPGFEGGHREGESGADPTRNEHHLRERHPPRVPTLDDIEQLETELQAAFVGGDPTAAWQKSQELISLAKNIARQSSKDRFKVNYGTPNCESCSGLKAGPDVIATCFQVRQCNYSNVRNPSSRQTGLIARLTKE
jgi:hypothetical protein